MTKIYTINIKCDTKLSSTQILNFLFSKKINESFCFKNVSNLTSNFFRQNGWFIFPPKESVQERKRSKAKAFKSESIQEQNLVVYFFIKIYIINFPYKFFNSINIISCECMFMIGSLCEEHIKFTSSIQRNILVRHS